MPASHRCDRPGSTSKAEVAYPGSPRRPPRQQHADAPDRHSTERATPRPHPRRHPTKPRRQRRGEAVGNRHEQSRAARSRADPAVGHRNATMHGAPAQHPRGMLSFLVPLHPPMQLNRRHTRRPRMSPVQIRQPVRVGLIPASPHPSPTTTRLASLSRSTGTSRSRSPDGERSSAHRRGGGPSERP